MKRFFALFTALCLAFSFYASAATVTSPDGEVTLALDDKYTALTAENLSKSGDFLKLLGETAKSFSAKMESAGIVIFAADSTNRHQVQVCVNETDFSAKVGDLNTVSDDLLEEAVAVAMADVVTSGGNSVLAVSVITGSDGMKYCCFEVREKQTRFCYVQYVTVANGKYYSLVYYNASPELSEDEKAEAERIFAGMTVERSLRRQEMSVMTAFEIVGVAVAIIAGAVLVVFLIRTFVRDFRERRRRPDTVVPDRLKMRRK